MRELLAGGWRPGVSENQVMAFPGHVRRCLCLLAEILFLAGLIWLLLLFLASLIGGSQGAHVREGGLLIGLAFLLPAPLLFFLDLGFRHYLHSTRPVSQDHGMGWTADGNLWTTVRRERQDPSPPSRSQEVAEPGPSAVPWWAERPPTYEEAMLMPKFEELAPRVHEAHRGHFQV